MTNTLFGVIISNLDLKINEKIFVDLTNSNKISNVINLMEIGKQNF